jgi:tetratricopeptide (TPR) repeat protein
LAPSRARRYDDSTVSRAYLLVALLLAGCATAVPASVPAPSPRADAPPSAPPTPGPAPSAPSAPTTTPADPAADARAQLERGRQLLARGEPATAAVALRQALRLQPELIPARTSLGQALYALGDLDGAVEELGSALRRQPDAIDARLALATVLVARQEWPAARQELERVLAIEPDRIDARYTLAGVRYAQGDVAGAIDGYRRVLAVEPEQHDARFNLALVLKLARRDAEATPQFVTAAQAGHARAQYFAGTAYADGLGVERNLATAVAWWFRAAEQGVAPAADALAQLRQTALGRGRASSAATRQAAEQAFRDYRAALWRDFPDLTASGEEPVGAALLRQGRVPEAVTMLIREASALSQPAAQLLETIYEQGVDTRLPAHDARILAYLKVAASEGLRPPPR